MKIWKLLCKRRTRHVRSIECGCLWRF